MARRKDEENRMNTQNIFDISALHAAASGNPELERGLIIRFFAASEPVVAELSSAIETGSGILVTRAAHTLAEIARPVGACAVTAICEEIECAARAGDLSQLEPHVLALADVLEEMRGYFLDYFEGVA